LSYKFYQDYVELFYQKIRSRDGYNNNNNNNNNNPNALQLHAI